MFLLKEKKMIKNSTILITGGTGSWGRYVTTQLLVHKELGQDCIPKKIVIFSRGEIAQVNMQRDIDDKRVDFIIGDVRDSNAIESVFEKYQFDIVYHLAALKHVPVCEYQPVEAIKTNVNGTINMIKASTKYKVKRFLYVSTDKAVEPNNLYGLTKATAEKLIIQANCNTKDTEFFCIRGGNILGTNGSLVPLIIEQIKTKGRVTLTDERMTRFFSTMSDIVDMLLFFTGEGIGGEIYVMEMPCFYIKDLIEVLVEYYGEWLDVKIDITGSRVGEKIHEGLISEFEIKSTKKAPHDSYVIYPDLVTGRTYWHIWDSSVVKGFTGVTLEKFNSKTAKKQSKEQILNILKEGGFLI